MTGVFEHCAAFLVFLLPVSHIFRNKLQIQKRKIFIKIHVVGEVKDKIYSLCNVFNCVFNERIIRLLHFVLQCSNFCKLI